MFDNDFGNDVAAEPKNMANKTIAKIEYITIVKIVLNIIFDIKITLYFYIFVAFLNVSFGEMFLLILMPASLKQSTAK